MNKKSVILSKVLNSFVSILLIFQSFAPGLLYAQEATSTATVEATPGPSVEPAPVPVESATPAPEPTLEPTPASTTNPEPSPVPSALPEISPTPTLSSSPSVEPLPTNQVENNSSPEQTVGQPNAPPAENPNPSLTPEPSSSVAAQQPPEGHLSATILENTDAQDLQLDLTIQDGVSSASLSTDKADYSPTDTAVISGSDFPKWTDLKLIILADNYRLEDSVKTDENGSFIYTYQLDGTYRPLYTVEAQGLQGQILATTSFTDASGASADLDQCANGRFTSPVPCTGSAWQNGNVNSNQAHYRENDSVPYRFKMSGIGGGTHTITIQWDTTKSGKHALDYITTYNRTETAADPCSGIAGCGSPTTFPIPTDPNAVNQVAGNFAMFNGTISSVSGYTVSGADNATSITITFTATNSTPVLAIGGHIASQIDWGSGNAAGSVPGSPYHMRLINLDGGGGNQDRSLAAGAILLPPSTATQVYKGTVNLGNNGSIFLGDAVTDKTTYSGNTGAVSGTTNFYVCGPTETPANCSSGGTAVGGAVTNASNQATSASFVPDTLGNYCFRAEYTPDSSAQYSPTVHFNSTSECFSVTNQPTATINVVKHVTNDNGGTKTASDFTINVTATNPNPATFPGSESGTQVTVTPGNYNIDEASVSGYQKTLSSDCSGSISGGQTKTCTITNDDIASTLTVIKTVVNDNGGTKQISDFPLFIDQTQVTSGQASNINPGTYTVSETNQTGYNATISGDCNSQGQVTLALGDNKTCTITNDDSPAHLIVIKNVVNDNGGNAVASDFTMTINNVTAAGGNSFPGSSTGTDKTLTTVGSYSITESGPSGYNASYSSDCNGSIALDQTKTCTISNNDIAPTITLIKEVTRDNGGNASSNDFGLTIGGQSVSSGQTLSLNANTPLAINEAGLSGYTFVSITGDAKCPSALGGTVTLNEGENVTCTITNNDSAPSLTLVKTVTNNNGGTAQASDWTLTASGPTGFSGPGPSVSSDSSFKAGTYGLSESDGPSGYSASSWSCRGGLQNGNQITLGLGESATCTITNDDEAGTLIVKKIVRNDNGGTLSEEDFSFKVNNGSAVPFEADGQNELTVDVGTYTITEPSVDGYDASYDNCSDIVIVNGGSQTCTITNDDKPAHLIVIKQVDNDNGGTALPSDFTMAINGVVVQSEGSSFSGEDAPGTDRVVEPGTYSVTEEGPPGYSSSFSSGCSGTIALGQTKTCTVTNSDVKPTLQVIKVVVNDNGGGAEIGDFPLKVDNITVTSGDINSLDAGTYVVSETNQPGYTATFSGDCDENGSVTLAVGDDLRVCTITNDDVAPTLTLVKHLPNNNGGTANQNDFGVYINDEEVDWGLNTVDVGNLTVSEDTLPGYEPSVWSGDCDEDGNVSLLPGDNKTCEITNDDQPGTLIVKKVVVNDNGGTKNAEDFFFSVNEASPAAFEADGQNDLTVDAGTYNVTEPEVLGYSTSYDNCSDIQVTNGGSATCTITNDDIAPVLTLVKTVINDNGGTATQDNFPVYINGQVSSWGAHTLPAGNYTVSEATASGYTPSSWGNDCAANGTVTLNAGDNKTCEITNDDQPGKISGKKFNDLNGDHTKDTGEPGLEGWTITLDKENDINPPACIGGTIIGELCIKTTNSFGNYAFNGLEPGAYIVSEVLQPGWAQTRPDAIYGGQGHQANGTYLLTIGSGTEIGGRDFGNQGRGSITLDKVTDPSGSSQAFGFTLSGQASGSASLKDQDAPHTFNNIPAGSYTISEASVDGWHLSGVDCGGSGSSQEGNSVNLTLGSGQTPTCTFTNTRDRGTIEVHKKVDDGSNTYQTGDGGANEIGFSWNLDGGASQTMGSSTGATTGDKHEINETVVPGYLFTGWFETDSRDFDCTNPEGTSLPVSLTVTRDQTRSITLCNQIQNPVLTLAKTNDKLGIDVSAGANVLYTLTVTLAGSPLSNVSLTDLPPAGFKYRLGSWTANSNTRGNLSLGPTTEPTYASPGTWNLGNMASGEVVTLTYIADIDSLTDPGLYKDLAWSKGTGVSGAVLANQSSGFFVGTEVNVVKNISDSTAVEIIKKEQGEVLGTSIALPATGANAAWLIFAAFLLVGGAGMVFKGVSLRRKYE